MTNISTSTYRLGDPVVAARPRTNPISAVGTWHVAARPVSNCTDLFTTGGFRTMVGASTKRPTRPLGAST
jgi:hypothetical protein